MSTNPEIFDSLVNLERSGLTVLDDKILSYLISKPNLRYLKLAHNNLKELADFSQLKNLEYLDVRDNPELIKNVPALMDSLYTIKNLKHLHVDELTQQDEENLIVSIASLVTFNGTPLEEGMMSKEETQFFENLYNGLEGEEKTNFLHNEDFIEPPLDEKSFAAIQPLYDSILQLDEDDYSRTVKSEKIPFPDACSIVASELAKNYPNALKQEKISKGTLDLFFKCFELIDERIQIITMDPKIQETLRPIFGGFKAGFEEILNTERSMFSKDKQELTDKIEILKKDVEEADKEVSQLLIAAEELEKEAKDAEQAKQQLSEQFEKEKERLSEEVGWLRAELERSKNKLRQYELSGKKLVGTPNSGNRASFTLSPTQRTAYVTGGKISPKSAQQQMKTQTAQTKQAIQTSKPPLTLRQLKDIIDEIYASKLKFDQKCKENHLPRETMEQHLYTYLNQKYGLKNLILEWASVIIKGVKRFSSVDNEVNVFGKIFRNEIDEEFRFVAKQLKDTVLELLKVYLKGKYPLKVDSEISKMMNSRMDGYLNEDEWVDIVKYMYNKEDSVNVIIKVKNTIAKESSEEMNNSQKENNLSLEEMNSSQGKDKIPSPQNENRVRYRSFVETLLSYQLKTHEMFLEQFVRLFRQFDLDRNGILNELEFQNLLLAINQNRTEEEIAEILNQVDPFNNHSITFSECVIFLSGELVGLALSTSKRAKTEKDTQIMTEKPVVEQN